VLCITNILPAFIGKRANDMVTGQIWKWSSIQRQWLIAWHLGESEWRLVAHIHISGIGCLDMQNQNWNAPCPTMKFSVNRVWTIFGPVSKLNEKWLGRSYAKPMYWQLVYAKEKATRSLAQSEYEGQRSVNDYWLCILGIPSRDWLKISTNEVLAACTCQH